MTNIQTLRQLTDIYTFTEFDVNGNEIPMSNYKGKVCIIVNITGKDSNAESFFKQLYILNSHFKTKGISILVFPCCQFGAQENVDELLVFIKKFGYDIGKIFQQIQVNGNKCPDLYKFLKLKKPGNLGGFISTNFTMFIVDKKGRPVERINWSVSKFDEIKDKIENTFNL